MGNKKCATCFVTLLQNELNSDVMHFTTHENKPCNLICSKKGSTVDGKMCNIAIQLVLQQCCKISCMFFVAHFTVALNGTVSMKLLLNLEINLEFCRDFLS